MATNRVLDKARYLTVAIASKSSGDHTLFGAIPGVCVIDTDADGNVVMDTGGVYDLSVTGADDAGNAAVALGDIIYDDAGTLNVDAVNGTRFGYALEVVGSGATTTIQVKVGY